MTILEQQLSIPINAYLPTNGEAAKLTTGTTSLSLSQSTSINQSNKFLLVGRQASTADIRIDHKSISRKHAVLYFTKTQQDRQGIGNGHEKNMLMLRDMGGKYGCLLNGSKVNGEVVLENGSRVQFGNVRESLFTVEIDDELLSKKPATEKLATGARDFEKEPDGVGIEEKDEEVQDVPVLTGRAAREAEIAKMMASLDDNPTYTKFKPTADQSAINANNENIPSGKKEQKIPSIATQLKLPITSSITLSTPSQSSSLPTTISLDPAGSRLIVGLSDTTLRMYDFNGMDLSAKPFKIVTIQDGHSIVKAAYSNTGDRMIVGTTSAQPMILDRDGHEIIEFNKGDMYVTDMTHTDGHVSNITGVDWHPLNRNLVITSSLDGSVRLWDLDKNKTKFRKLCSAKDKVYRIKSSMGKRTKVTCVVFAPGGREFACGTICGSVQVWSTAKVGSRPERVVYDAHLSGSRGMAIHSLTYNFDGKKLASRCMDDGCVKVWDARRLSRTAQPLSICKGLHGLYESVNCAFSPDGRILCAGTCIEPRNITTEYGILKFYRVDNSTAKTKPSEPIFELDVAQGLSIVNVTWHNKLNQIIVSLSDGSIRVFYDMKWSSNGAKLPVAKGLRKTDDLTLLLNSRAPQGSAGVLGEIRTPHALPLFREEVETKNTKRKRENERKDPIKSKRPDLPGTGIKVSEGTSAGLNFQQTVLTSAISKNKNIAGKDPREELFKYKEGKEYTKVPYDGDRRILAEKTLEEEEEEMKKKGTE
jgi:WD40 repeat protein